MRALAPLLFALPLSLAAIAIAGACSDDSPIPCPGGMLDGGCPLIDPDADQCEDPECNALYACEQGVWVFLLACPSHAVSASVDASADGAEDAPVAEASADDAAFDAPPGAFGGTCAVQPVFPDCWLGQAIATPSLCTSCDDEESCCDLYVCDDGGMTPYGYCNNGGVVYAP